jgi:hypothetical protein
MRAFGSTSTTCIIQVIWIVPASATADDDVWADLRLFDRLCVVCENDCVGCGVDLFAQHAVYLIVHLHPVVSGRCSSSLQLSSRVVCGIHESSSATMNTCLSCVMLELCLLRELHVLLSATVCYIITSSCIPSTVSPVQNTSY